MSDLAPAASQPASAPPWPCAVGLLLLLILGVAFGLAAREGRETAPDGYDQATVQWIASHRDAAPGLTRLLRVVTRLGDWPWSALATLLAAGTVTLIPGREPRSGRRLEALFFLGTVSASWILGRALKLVFHRPRPLPSYRMITAHSTSFPSGHSVFAAVYFGMIAVLIWQWARGGRLARVGLVMLCLGMIGLVSLSRIWLGVHYLSDVVGGALLGLGWVALVWTIRGLWSGRRSRRRAA